jgi:hypothetical protein
MAKKIKITESQLKMLVENKKKSTTDNKVMETKQPEVVEINEAVEKIKKSFKRFL